MWRAALSGGNADRRLQFTRAALLSLHEKQIALVTTFADRR